MTHHKTLKTGGDPRTLPDYAALREELSKLTHPARPDVNWRYAEKLCLSLFEQNGVELQTAAWYTLVRMQLAGLFGLSEGLAILEALISHQWGTLWPQPIHARMEILSGLSQRIQQRMRTLPLSYSDLPQLYRAEQRLTTLGAVLQRLELKHLSQFDTLRTLMHNSAIGLENRDGAGPEAIIQPSVVLPTAVINNSGASVDAQASIFVAEKNESASTVKWVYVAQPELQPNVAVLTAVPAPTKKWKPFVAGMCTMLMVCVATVWGWAYFHRTDPLQAQLAASLAPLPTTLTPAQLEMLRQQSPLPQTLITETQHQLARLDKLPPDWNIAYGRELIEQAQSLWPDQAKALAQQWQQQRNAAILPTEQLNGWYQGMAALQKLTDRLNALDEKRGKYMTVSELKSEVFEMQTHFRQAVPVEEQLRAIQLQQDDSPARQQQIQQTEQHLRAQAYVLMQEKERNPAAK